MGASIYYQAVKGKHLPMGGSSSFLEKLREAFGQEGTITLLDSDYHKLAGLKIGIEDKEQKAAIEELMEAISNYSEVRVWAEY